LHLRDLVFLGHIDPDSALNGVDNGGLYAVATFLVALLVAAGVLLQRYRWVEH
jgi:hypothetical protein